MKDNETTAKKASKSRHTGLIAALVLLVVLIAGADFYGYTLYTQPKKTVDKFLKEVQALDFEGIAAFVSGGDITPLEEAEITDPAYEEFFRKANALMTYHIQGMNFRLKSATVTVNIQYPDATEIYKSAASDFMKQIISSSFSGTQISSEDMNTQLAQYLNQHGETLGQNFTETTIDFYLVKEGSGWYLDTLDTPVVEMISANFKSTQEELSQSIANMANGESSASIPENLPSDSTINFSGTTFSITYAKHAVSTDWEGNPCLLVYYDYTNNGSSASSAMVDVMLRAYQGGQALEITVPGTDDPAIAQYMAEIEPNTTVQVCQVFALKDTSQVTLAATAAYSFSSEAAYQLLNIQ